MISDSSLEALGFGKKIVGDIGSGRKNVGGIGGGRRRMEGVEAC